MKLCRERKKGWKITGWMMVGIMMASVSGMAHAYTADVSCFFEGVRLDTGEQSQDPSVLVMIFGEPDEIERVLMTDGDFA